MIMLTTEERERFASYLEQECLSDTEFSQRLTKIGGSESMVKKLNAEAMSEKIIAMKLRAYEQS